MSPKNPSPIIPKDAKVAILLNGNARKVKPYLIDRLSRYIPRQDIYFSKTLEEAERICYIVYQKEYDLLFTAGGDGTFLHCLTELEKYKKADNKPKKLPVMGILPFGTGNAVASVLGGQRKCGNDLLKAQQGKGLQVRAHRWVEVNGTLAPFAGMGADSVILNNFKRIGNATKNSFLSFLGRGAIGYFLSIAGMSIPQVLIQKRPQIKVINEGGTAYQIGSDGQYIREFAHGEVMYEGPSFITAFSTLRCYGFSFNLFPFADSGQHMQMRIANMKVPQVLSNLLGIWKGAYRNEESLFDFHVEKVRVITEKPQPLQIGGDAAGYHQETVYKISDEVTYLADFSKPKQLPGFNNPQQLPAA